MSKFYTRTILAEGLKKLFAELESRANITKPVKVFLAGGMAVHLYTANRVTTDVDAEFSTKIILPNDLMVDVNLEDGTNQLIYFDTNYNSSFALLHEDYLEDAIPVDLGLKYIQLFVLSPVDLAVSKISRFAENDQEDIKALVKAGLTNAEEIEKRATDALTGYIGNFSNISLNIRDAVQLAKQLQAD